LVGSARADVVALTLDLEVVGTWVEGAEQRYV
jgi:N-acetylglucosamine-6-phosphate deacetylase